MKHSKNDEKNKYNKDIEDYIKSLKNTSSKYGNKSKQVAACYNTLGVAYQEAGDSLNALENKLKSLKLRESLYKNESDNEELAESNYNVSIAYRSLGDSKLATSHAKKAHEIRTKLVKKNNNYKSQYLVFKSLSCLGEAYQLSGVNKKALDNYLKALDLLKSLDNNDNEKTNNELVICYTNVGNAYHSLGYYNQIG